MLVSVLAVVVVFGVIVLVHELGHMLAAKACGVAVPDFALGMGPSLVSRLAGETRYHLCALPLGGFVRIAGMEGDEALDGRTFPFHRSWRGKNGWQRAFILVSGALMNVVLGIAVMFAMGALGFPEPMVMVGLVEPGSPAESAGLKAGDLITELAGKRVTNSRQLMAVVQAHRDGPVRLSYIRGTEEHAVEVAPRVISGFNHGRVSLGVGLSDQDYVTTEISLVQPKTAGFTKGLRINDRIVAVNGEPATTGTQVVLAFALFNERGEPVDEHGNPIPPGGGTPVVLDVQRAGGAGQAPGLLHFTFPGDTTALTLGVAFKPKLQRLPLVESARRSLQDGQNMMIGMLFGLRMLFTSEGLKGVAGPVGIMNVIAQSAQSNLYTFLQVLMLINLNLALLNLLPLPALDGGRLVFVALAGIGIRIPEKREALVHAAGMVMLLGLILLVTFTDVLGLL